MSSAGHLGIPGKGWTQRRTLAETEQRPGGKQTKAAMADCCDFFPAVKSLEHKSGAYSCYALRAEDEESLSFALFIALRKGVR